VVIAQRPPFPGALDGTLRESLRGVVAVGRGECDDQRDEPAGVGDGLEVCRALGQRGYLAGVCASLSRARARWASSRRSSGAAPVIGASASASEATA
jgi:hypothetical protein